MYNCRHSNKFIYYKVLFRGRSCHGGTLKWSIPKDGKPGKWHHVKGQPVICIRGLHVTDEPFRWLGRRNSLYLCEVAGRRAMDGHADKIAVQRCRLLRRIRKKMSGGYLWELLGNARKEDSLKRRKRRTKAKT